MKYTVKIIKYPAYHAARFDPPLLINGRIMDTIVRENLLPITNINDILEAVDYASYGNIKLEEKSIRIIKN